MTPTGDYPLFTLRSRVISGAALGKSFGFPTANLDADPTGFPFGVYAVRVTVHKQTHWGLLHCGPRETVGLPSSLEVWIEDFEGSVYGETIEIVALKKIRDVKKFNDTNKLHEAIAADVTALQAVKEEA